MTKLNFLGSMLVAFALGGAGMWAYQGNFQPMLRHVVAAVHHHSTDAVKPGGVASNNSGSVPTGRIIGHVNSNPGSALAQRQSSRDPFQQMLAMQQRMDSQMNRLFNGQANVFNFGPGGFFGNSGNQGVTQQGAGPMNSFSFFSNGNATSWNGASLQKGEDNKSVYYKLNVGKKDLSNLKVNVDNGYVSIDARLQNKAAGSYSSSSISESFPVPAGVDPNSAKITHEGDDVVIRFAKV